MARRWRIEGYEQDDIIQEIYLCLLLEEDWGKHLRKLKQRGYERNTREVTRPLHEEDPAWLAANDVRTLTADDIPALVVRLACEHECRNEKDRQLLKDITTGTEYPELAQRASISFEGAKTRVKRFRKYLFPRLYPEGRID